MVEGGDPASVFFRDVTGPRGGPRKREGDPRRWPWPHEPQEMSRAVWCRSGRAGGRTGAPGDPFEGRDPSGVIPPRGEARGGGAGNRTRVPVPPGGGCGVPVAESVLAPPGPIPNPVVTQRSAGEYCGGDPTGGEAAAGTPHRLTEARGRPDGQTARSRWPAGQAPVAGWSSGSSLGS